MSVIFNVDGEAAKRTTNIVAGSSDYTCLFYAKNNVTTAAGGKTLFVTYNGAGTYTNYVAIFSKDDGTIYLECDAGGGFSASTAVAWVVGDWYRIAYVRQGSANRFYVQAPDGALTLIGTVTLAMGAASFTETWIGSDGLAADHADLEIGYFREWNTPLSLTQMGIEFSAPVAFKDTLLVTDTPLQADLDDISGNNNDFTAVGSLSFAADEPAFPANSGPTTAEDITLPFTDAIDLEVGGLQFQAWYKYTSGTESVIGFWAYGDGLTPLVVVTNVSADSFGPNTSIINSKTNRPVQVPNPTPGTVFYFQVAPNFAATSDLIVSALAFNNGTVPIGSIAVNDDEENFPLAILSGVDGDDYNVLAFINNYVMGEAGDVLATGEACTSDNQNNTIVIYDNQYVEVTSQAITVSSNGGAIRTCQGTQRWWVGYTESSTRRARYVEADGSLGTAHVLTAIAQIECLAANNDETILYHCGTTASNRAIKRWDLVNDVALSDLIAEVTGYFTPDILVLSDDTIIYTLVDSTGTPDVQVRHVDSTGTILHTYNFGSSFVFPVSTPPRLAYAIDDPNSFWIWTHPILGTDDGLSRFQEVDIATGAILKEIDSAEYEVGAYQPDASLTPLSRFGNSFSCPFWIVRAEVGPTAGTGTLIVRKQTIPAGSLQAFDIEVGGGLSPSSITLQDGDEETYIDIPVGDGYSVEETPIPTGWMVGYDVSNGSPVDDILIEENTETIVIVTNLFAGGPGGGGGMFTVPTLPVVPTGPFPPLVNPPKPNDDIIQTPVGGVPTVVEVKIPNPFFVTGGLVDE
jgi:hypothetical protein